jgi:hypothetical protein
MAKISIANLFKDENFVPKLVDILSLFVFQVAKKDGSLYLPTK